MMQNLLPPDGRPVTVGDKGLLKSDLMCKDTQTKPDPEKSQRLQAAAGDFVALRYQENGHVTQPNNQLGKPPRGGKVFIYGTSQPSETDTFLSIHKQWNSEGTGGDKRGKLLATQDYDDGVCYQINGGDISQSRVKEFPHQADDVMGRDIWCQNDIALPSDLSVGKPYTLYWVWDWSTLPNIDPNLPDGKVEIYTTCMDIDITTSAEKSGVKANAKVRQRNADPQAPSPDNTVLNNAAIPKYMDELRNLGAAPGPSAAAPTSQPSPSKAPESSQKSNPEAPQDRVTITVTQKPAVVSTTITVMVTPASETPTTTVTLPQSTMTVVGKTVTETLEPSGTPQPSTVTAPLSAENGNSGDAAFSKRCDSCNKHKRSRILGRGRHRHY